MPQSLGPQSVNDLAWGLVYALWTLLGFVGTFFLYRIDANVRKASRWRAEESAAINEIQGRCAAAHPNMPPIRHLLTPDN